MQYVIEIALSKSITIEGRINKSAEKATSCSFSVSSSFLK
jgi:hypothetical protein